VATTVGDNAHVLEDGVTGLLVESGDVASMATALARLADPKLRHTLGQAAQTRFKDKFTLEHMVHAYEDVYRQLAGPAPIGR